MSENKDKKEISPLVQSVLTLDERFAEMDRLSQRIDEIELKSDFDYNQARRLMARFSDCANSINVDVLELSTQLNNARLRGETAANLVAAKADTIYARQTEEDKKMEAFRALAAKVNALGQEMKELKRPDGDMLSGDERALLVSRLSDLDMKLQPLIEEARVFKKEAQAAKMKVLEQNAESLSQSLTAVSQKLSEFTHEPIH